MTPRTEAQTAAVVTAATTLAALSDRMSRAAASLARMVSRLVIEDDATKVGTSIAKYVNSGMPEANAVADVAAVLEGAQSPEWQAKRAKQRHKSQQRRLEWQLDRGGVNEHDRPSFGGVMPEAVRGACWRPRGTNATCWLRPSPLVSSGVTATKF
jgi:hypothetical protein